MQRTLRSRIEQLEKRPPPTIALDGPSYASLAEIELRLQQILGDRSRATAAGAGRRIRSVVAKPDAYSTHRAARGGRAPRHRMERATRLGGRCFYRVFFACSFASP